MNNKPFALLALILIIVLISSVVVNACHNTGVGSNCELDFHAGEPHNKDKTSETPPTVESKTLPTEESGGSEEDDSGSTNSDDEGTTEKEDGGSEEDKVEITQIDGTRTAIISSSGKSLQLTGPIIHGIKSDEIDIDETLKRNFESDESDDSIKEVLVLKNGNVRTTSDDSTIIETTNNGKKVKTISSTGTEGLYVIEFYDSEGKKVTSVIFEKENNGREKVVMTPYAYGLYKNAVNNVNNINEKNLNKVANIEGFTSANPEGKVEFNAERGKILRTQPYTKNLRLTQTIPISSEDSKSTVILSSTDDESKKVEMTAEQFAQFEEFKKKGIISENMKLLKENDKYIIVDDQSFLFSGKKRQVFIGSKNKDIKKYTNIRNELYGDAEAIAVIGIDDGKAKEVFFMGNTINGKKLVRAVPSYDNEKIISTAVYEASSGFLTEYTKGGKTIQVKYGKLKDGTLNYADITLTDGSGSPIGREDNSEVVQEVKNMIFWSRFGVKLSNAAQAASGASALGNFLFKGNELFEAWGNFVDEIFSYLEPQRLFTGLFCSDFVRRGRDQGTALTFVNDEIKIVAHVEGSRSSAVQPVDENGTLPVEYFYKLTWVVKAPSDKDIGFNVRITGQRDVRLFSSFVKLEKGQTHQTTGNNARVKYSNFLYNQICIEFEGDVDWPNPLCNKIVEQSGPTIEQARAARAHSQASGSSGGGSSREAQAVPVNNW